MWQLIWKKTEEMTQITPDLVEWDIWFKETFKITPDLVECDS